MTRARQNVPRRTSMLAGVGLGALAVAVLGFAALLAVGWSPFSSQEVDRSAPVVLQQLQDLAAYRAASGEFSQLVDIEDDVKLLPDFLAGERTVMVAVGSIDAEVDFSRLDRDHVTVSEDGKRVEVHLPPAQLGQVRLDFEQTHVATRSRGLANRVSEALTSNAQDDQELYRKAEAQIAQAAAATELQRKAEENTRAMLVGLLGGLGYDDVVVSFDAPLT